MLLQGIYPALTTPFYSDGRLYLKKIEHNADRYSRTPIAGVVVLGSTGEAVMLSDEEKREVLRATRAATADAKVLIAGTGAESAIETLKLTEYAARLGYDAALVRTPFYYRAQVTHGDAGAKSQLAFYRWVADRSPLPLVLYSVPPFTAYDLPIEVVQELAQHDNIIGLKESSGNVARVRELVERTKQYKKTFAVTPTFEAATQRMLSAGSASAAPDAAGLVTTIANAESAVAVSDPPKSAVKTRTKEVPFQVLVGAAHTLQDSLQAGAAGAVLAFADPAPTACFEVYAAWKDNDQKLAAVKQERITSAAKRMGGEFGVAGVKYAMDLNGYYGGPTRLPLLPLTGDQRAQIDDMMREIRN